MEYPMTLILLTIIVFAAVALCFYLAGKPRVEGDEENPYMYYRAPLAGGEREGKGE